LAQADVKLVYDITTATGDQKQASISLAGRWLRLDMQPGSDVDYVIIDTGRQIMFEVDDDKKQFEVTRMGPPYWPKNEALLNPGFKPLRKKQTIAGATCQLVNELDRSNPQDPVVANHCMAPGSALKLGPRQTITLSRLFMLFRRIGMDWFGVATPDERQVSVLSAYKSGAKLQLKSIKPFFSTKTFYKVPVEYKRIDINS
jgi:hypothetical protein